MLELHSLTFDFEVVQHISILFTRQRHNYIGVVIVCLEDGGILGIDQFGGYGGRVVQRLERINQIARVEGNVDIFTLISDGQLDVRATNISGLAQ